ncbi:MAG: ABC transporter substrate-binding protein [Acidobacteriota bacterium]|nr:MAG: ABC transporter substrate-binding protein [Acidobacteriota bacterium]
MRILLCSVVLGLSLPTHAQELRVLTTELPPFFYLDGGEPAGIEYEILSYHARAAGLELDIHWLAHWPELLPALEEGKGDLVAAALTVTEERKQRFDFATPHFPVRMHLVEHSDNETREVSELAGTKLGVLAGSTGAEAFASVRAATIVEYPSPADLFRAAAEGEVRAIACESADAYLFLQEFHSLRLGIPLSEQQHYGFALAKNSPHREALNESILRLKQSGIYYRIVEKYLGKHAATHFKESAQ